MPIMPASVISNVVVDPITISPTTSSQKINIVEGIDGYGPISVNAVTSSIDENIQAGNIKSGVSILGVSGSVTELNGSTKTVTPTTSQQTITPTSPSNGLTSVTVNAVTSAIDSNIQAENIKKDVTILGVTGTHEGGGINPEEYLIADFGAGDSSYARHFIKKSEWDNLSVGDVLNLYDAFGNLITGAYHPNPSMAYVYTTPFILQSKGKTGIIDKASIKDATNKTVTLSIVKTENCYDIYSTEQFAGLKTFIIGQLYPKIGDEIKQYSEDATYLINLSHIITTCSDLPGYSTSVPLEYYEKDSQTSSTAYGPITIKDIKIEAGRTTLILQDKNGNTLNNTWRSARPAGDYPTRITENGDYSVAYYERVTVDVPTPSSSGGGYVPLAITDYEGNTYVRRFNTGSAKDFYAWQDEMGNMCYTCPLDNLSTLTSGSDMFSDWGLQNSIGLTPNHIYAGGIRTNGGIIAYVSDLIEGQLRVKTSDGMEVGFPEYRLPGVGEHAGPWGEVEEVYDSTIPMPVAIRGDSVGWLFFDYTEDDEYEGSRMIFSNNDGGEYSVHGSKFYGIGNYSICDFMGYSQEGIIEQYSFLGIVVNGEKYASTGNIENTAAEFSNGTQSLYVSISDPLDSGTSVYGTYDLTEPIGSIDEVLSAQ